MKSKNQELTFAPVINTNYAYAQAPPNKRETIREQILSERQQSEMSECTFKPKIMINFKHNDQIEIDRMVSGMERFYELKDLQKRKNADLAARCK